RLRRVGEIGAGDEHCVVARRPRRQLVRAREEPRRPVLHRAEQPPVVVVVHRPPRAPLVLRAADPLLLVHLPAAARLPPRALVAHRRRGLERRTGQPGDARAHTRGPISSTTTSTVDGATSAMRSRYSRTRACTSDAMEGIDAPQSTARWSSPRTFPSLSRTLAPRRRGSSRTPTISRAASAA